MIPFQEFGQYGQPLHFLHANGYPPLAYRPLLARLGERYCVRAMYSRALWGDCDPAEVQDWLPFAADLSRFLEEQGWEQGVIGVGHSIGGNTTLRLALQQPDRFRAIVLLDPVLFEPRLIWTWKLIYRLGLAYRLHPLVKGALKRRNRFESRAAMFANYRRKPVFSRLSDESLAAYVDSLACEQPDGSMELCYPPEWEARVYVTSMRADLALWRMLPRLKPPALVIRGAESDTFLEPAARRFQQKLPTACMVSLAHTGHLLPLEAPDEVDAILQKFLDTGEHG